MTDDARQARIHASNLRWRAIFTLLAVVVPLALFLLFRRQEMRLRALADHGRTEIATVTHLTRQDAALYTHYAYAVDGAAYSWSVSRSEAPYAPGESFPITVLPEDPSLSRPVVPYSRERLEAELDMRFRYGVPIGALVFFGGAALLCHRAVRKMQRGEPLRTKPLISPDAAGRVLAVLLLGATLAAGFDPKVRAVQAALMGPAPLGLPPVVVASIVQVVLFLPYFWVMPHLMRIVSSAQARGHGFGKVGILLAVATAPAEQRRSRLIVIAGGVYFFALLAGWIALTSARGV